MHNDYFSREEKTFTSHNLGCQIVEMAMFCTVEKNRRIAHFAVRLGCMFNLTVLHETEAFKLEICFG